MVRLHCAVLLAAALFAVFTEQATASFANVDLDVDGPIQNEEAFQRTMRCVFGNDDYRDCDSHSVTIKYIISRLVVRGCTSCTEEELKVFRFMAYMSNNRPAEWRRILNMHDPQGKSKEKNGAQWKEHGIAV